jgi:hypothetical protein
VGAAEFHPTPSTLVGDDGDDDDDEHLATHAARATRKQKYTRPPPTRRANSLLSALSAISRRQKCTRPVYEACSVRASTPLLAFVFATLAALTATRPAGAANASVEGAAKKALKAAEADYLAMKYAAGADRLKKAAAACGASGCEPQTKAALECDLATMLFRKGDKAEAVKSWKIAVKIKGDVALNPAYEQADVVAAFVSATIGPPPRGDFQHEPPKEQEVNTPLPLYFEGGKPGVAHVVVFYQPPGSGEWKTVDLPKVGHGWGGNVPCGEMTQGLLKYYVQGTNSHRSPVANSGDGAHPFVVPIRGAIAGDAPHLPGQAPPRSCSGAHSEEHAATGAKKEEEEPAPSEEKHEKAEKGESREGEQPEHKPEEKGENESPGESHFRRIWVGAAFGLEFMLMPPGNDVCHLDTVTAEPDDTNHLYCTTPNGADFPTRDPIGYVQNGQLVPGQAGQSSGSIQPLARLMATFDFAVTRNLLLGARAGAVVLTPIYPGQAAIIDGRASSFGRLHLEARATWVFGDNPLGDKGFAPLAFVGGGISRFDAHVSSTATINTAPAGMPPVTYTGGVNIWKTDGPGFVTGGVGVRWAPIEPLAFTLAARANMAFGNGEFLTFGPELAAAYGF